MQYYKLISADAAPIHGGDLSFRWPLPQGGNPGAWTRPVKGAVEAGSRGYHLVHEDELQGWMTPFAVVYRAEGKGDADREDTKTAFRTARLVRCVGRVSPRIIELWLADCAERVLPIFEKSHPDDPRPRLAIEATRNGTREQRSDASLAAKAAAKAAARDASGDAAWEAASIAARTAAGVASRLDAIEAAALAAWESAPRDARGVTSEAARGAERSWQNTRLLELLEQYGQEP